MPDALVDCVVTSPAYWGLRDYGTDPIIWGGDPECAHEWSDEESVSIDNSDKRRWNHAINGRGEEQPEQKRMQRKSGSVTHGSFCRICGAWRGSLGLEPTLDLYISHLVEIFREVRRVLKDEGTLWLNCGDSYCGGGRAGNNPEYYGKHKMFGKTGWDPGVFGKSQPVPVGLKPKDLIGQPWRLAFALQADGWWLRSDVIEEVELYCPCGCGYVLEERIWRWSQDRDLIWSKPNPMPESVKGTGYYRHKIRQITNGKKEWVECPGCEKCNPHGGYVLRWNAGRPTKSHEYIFLLSKSAKYFYDAEAVKEEATTTRPDLLKFGPRPDVGGTGHMNDRRRAKNLRSAESPRIHGNLPGRSDGGAACNKPGQTYRNKRTVWTVATQPFPAAHFATFPEKLIEPCVRAGTSEKGYCAECGKPWVRVVKTESPPLSVFTKTSVQNDENDLLYTPRKDGIKVGAGQKYQNWRNEHPSQTIGWQPSCSCGANTVPGLVLDPFGGAGTVALEAKKLNRDFLIIELKPEYCDMSRRRLAERMPLFVGGELLG